MMKTKLFSICALCVAVFMSVPVSAETFDELMKKAQAGDANSQYTLAQKYKNGEGVAQDKAEAVRWHTKAAEQGHIFSQFTLAEMYTSYSYSCDATANTDAAEKYIAELTGSYDFVQTAHEPGGKNRKVSKSAKTAESWFFKYTGSKKAKSFELGRGKNKRKCHVAVQMTRDAKKNRTSFRILVADGLVYGWDTKPTRRNK